MRVFDLLKSPGLFLFYLLLFLAAAWLLSWLGYY